MTRSNAQATTLELYDLRGRRKYLTGSEGRRFLNAAEQTDPATRALCRTLAFTGCRISEALSLRRPQLDLETGCIVFRTLKRRRHVFRAVPVPRSLLSQLLSLPASQDGDDRLWTCHRSTGWRKVKAVMACARIEGAQAMPKGLRHGFGIAAAGENIPGPLIRDWLGHSRLETTAIYQHAVGREERAFARRLWR